jgi:hypothetical protein
VCVCEGGGGAKTHAQVRRNHVGHFGPIWIIPDDAIVLGCRRRGRCWAWGRRRIWSTSATGNDTRFAPRRDARVCLWYPDRVRVGVAVVALGVPAEHYVQLMQLTRKQGRGINTRSAGIGGGPRVGRLGAREQWACVRTIDRMTCKSLHK